MVAEVCGNRKHFGDIKGASQQQRDYVFFHISLQCWFKLIGSSPHDVHIINYPPTEHLLICSSLQLSDLNPLRAFTFCICVDTFAKSVDGNIGIHIKCLAKVFILPHNLRFQTKVTLHPQTSMHLGILCYRPTQSDATKNFSICFK